ncbi:RNA Terminal Phosphate Cyclase-like protein [Cryptosporidium ryanae]|uniref:RNA Terminal Phosphate Cyclase-like protein n=1 Tax=Cryptosporidium ryanae TaxID=515981 RepID=UPI003519E0A5|nr:RNA Terminal Phosphate Cyclase-like protein [Cryptosporidium ryanae]
MLVFKGGGFLRQRLALSTISGKPIVIKDIRSDDTLCPGLNESETSLLHLLDCITNGSKIRINDTGTTVNYAPGIIIGGGTPDKPLVHNCHPSRGLSYYVEFLLLLALFGRDPLHIRLTGVTDKSGVDHSIDLVKMVTIPLFQKMIPQMGEAAVSVLKRSVHDDSLGIVYLNIPIIKKIDPIIMDGQIGKVKRVRGVAWYTGSASSQVALKMITKARGVMNRFIPDVWIYFDKPKKQDFSAKCESTGFGITLVSETLKGVIKGSDFSCTPSYNSVDDMLAVPFANMNKIYSSDSNLSQENGEETTDVECESDSSNEKKLTQRSFQGDSDILSEEFLNMNEWEKVGWLAATRLLLEIDSQSMVDTSHQIYPLLFMALSNDTAVSKLRLSKLTPITIQMLRDIRSFINVEFGIKEDEEAGDFITLSCTGIGFSNYARRAA